MSPLCVLTVRVLVVHHVQVILVCLHVSQQVICRDVTALCLLVVCAAREREISSSSHRWIHLQVSCPSMVCQALPEPQSSVPHHCHCHPGHGGKLSFCSTVGLGVLHPGAAARQINKINAPVYSLSMAEEGRAVGLGVCPPRNVSYPRC